ncbi:MAG: sodium-translocating pyrophosphatase [Clostridium argentinense]|uniref:Putative K(+)-stimulated pyrophosphate-energized sodium pump n=1 Tax=Clostridium faecium TaxID=2762223 RepID=A0ABR8YTS4_9CLOT|nr:sodium-translocating pyrophosphatase [Clostridium faecium]MBD8047630.1 sodium-translocating pyrophosphatase [Clostridium faecium]MBS5823267.1 sodium-translocating pyrophosphatase [Clostridium argentinense]MDU1349639.1 sodium-translocating pyrophosphatase [Clostridium argentinense]
MEQAYLLGIVGGVLAIIFAFYLSKTIVKEKEGNDRMIEIASYIKEGSMAFLRKEYTYLSVFIVIVVILLSIFINFQTGISFLCGAIFSILAGYFGMKIATSANVRTAEAAKHGISKALSIAFSGGAVMGMSVVGLGTLGISVIYLVFNGDTSILTGFGLGASSIALFARVGGGIYTKAADVGADIVGKVEAGIPEDDPRNPAVIADNVGDNVGDVAGMGADLFESYVGSIISAITLGAVVYKDSLNGVAYPIILVSLGILASIVGTIYVKASKSENPQKSLNAGTYIAGGLFLLGALFASNMIFGNFRSFFAVGSGMIIGILIGQLTEVYTSSDYKSVKKIADQSQTGAGTNIISGMSVGMKSTMGTILLVALEILIAYFVMGGSNNSTMGLYGIALSAIGMLSITGLIVAVDAYGPIADNAGGIAQMSDLPEQVREITDKLDSVGNTTAAKGKGFAIGSAALTSLALFASFAEASNLLEINVLNPITLVGMLVGVMLPFLFSALTMESVGKAANDMVKEVRRQFREIDGIMEGKNTPEYSKCVEISTHAALREMILPGILAIVVPILTGFLFGVEALGGLLSGAVSSGVLMAIMMANAGGAWDNAKKYVEEGHFGGKGSDTHKAAVVGDTVGDPFKDTSGPSMNILIKLMTIISLVFAPLIAEYGGVLINFLMK